MSSRPIGSQGLERQAGLAPIPQLEPCCSHQAYPEAYERVGLEFIWEVFCIEGIDLLDRNCEVDKCFCPEVSDKFILATL